MPRELWLEDLVAKAPVPPTVVAALVSAIASGLGTDGRTLRGTRFVLEGRLFRPVLGEAPPNMPPIAANEALGQVVFELLTGKRWHKGQLGYSLPSLLRQVSGAPAGEAVAEVCDGLLAGRLSVTAAKVRTDALSTLYRVDLTRQLDDLAAGGRNLKIELPEQSTGAFPVGFLAEAMAASSLPPTASLDITPPPPIPSPSPPGSPPWAAIALLVAAVLVGAAVLIGGLALVVLVGSW